MSMSQKTATDLLCRASRSLGEKAVHSLLPAPFGMRINDHDTGQQISIWAKIDEVPQVDIWRGSIWHSYRYEFNDERNPPGYREGAEWAASALEAFFERVRVAFDAEEQHRAQRLTEGQARAKAEHDRAMSVYATMVTGIKAFAP